MFRFTQMLTQLLVFPLGPQGQISVQFAHRRVKRRVVVSTEGKGFLTTAAEGGLEPVPVDRFRGAYPHQLSSCALLSLATFRARGARLAIIRDKTLL